MKRYILIVNQQPRGPYTNGELRCEVDLIAAGKTWGWRPTVTGAEAVCDGAVIAEAVEV